MSHTLCGECEHFATKMMTTTTNTHKYPTLCVLFCIRNICNLIKSMSKRCFGSNKSIVFVHSFAMAYHYPTYGSLKQFVLKLREKPVSFIFHLFEFVALISIHFISSKLLFAKIRMLSYVQFAVWRRQNFQCHANGQTDSLTTRNAFQRFRLVFWLTWILSTILFIQCVKRVLDVHSDKLLAGLCRANASPVATIRTIMKNGNEYSQIKTITHTHQRHMNTLNNAILVDKISCVSILHVYPTSDSVCVCVYVDMCMLEYVCQNVCALYLAYTSTC